MGSPSCAVAPLKSLLALGDSCCVAAVVAQPARPHGRGRTPTDPPLARAAREVGLTVLQPERARDASFLEEIKRLRPDVVVTAAYGQILSAEFLELPRLGTFNIHPSLLPDLRGATPVQTALLRGYRETGVTLLRTVQRLDAGPIVAQRQVEVEEYESAPTLMDRLFALGGDLLCEMIVRMGQDEKVQETPQDETRATHSQKIQKEDGKIDWTLSSSDIKNRIRAFAEWPQSYTFLSGRRVILAGVSQVPDGACQGGGQAAPGTVWYQRSAKVLVIACGSGCVAVPRVKIEGRGSTSAQAFWNGQRNPESLRFDP